MLWSYSYSLTAMHATRAQWISWRERAENSALYIYIHLYIYIYTKRNNQSINNPTNCGSSTLPQKITYSQQVTHQIITYVQKFCQYTDRFSFADDFMSDVVVSQTPEPCLTLSLPRPGKFQGSKMQGHACKQCIFQSYNASTFNAVHFDENPFACQCEKDD